MVEAIAIILNFSIVVFLVWHFSRKPLMEFLATRSQTIGSQMTEASELSAAAQKELQEWQGRWKDSEAVAHRQFEDAKQSVEKFRETALAHARIEAERIKKEAVLSGQSEAVKAEQRLRKELVHTSVAMARKFLSTSLEDKDKSKLLTDYLETVPNGHAR